MPLQSLGDVTYLYLIPIQYAFRRFETPVFYEGFKMGCALFDKNPAERIRIFQRGVEGAVTLE